MLTTAPVTNTSLLKTIKAQHPTPYYDGAQIEDLRTLKAQGLVSWVIVRGQGGYVITGSGVAKLKEVA